MAPPRNRRPDVPERADDLYEQLFEQSVDGIVLIDGGRILRANAAVARLLGRPREELVDTDAIELIHPDERPVARRRVAGLFRGETLSDSYVYRALHRDGRVVSIGVTMRLVRWNGRDILQITARDPAAEGATAREGEARYRSLFDSVPIGLYRTTPDGQVVDANLALVEMLGYPDRKTLLNTRVPDGYADRRDREAWKERIERDGSIANSEALWRRYDGAPVWVEENARAVRDEAGKVSFYEGSAKDISEQKRFEEALDREKAYLEQLFSGSPEAVVLCDDDGDVLRVNREFTKLFGYTEEEAVGRGIDALVAPDSEALRREAERITSRVTAGEQVTVESSRRRRDGTLVDVSVLAQPIFVGDRPVGVYAIYRDIGPRVAAEEALRREKKRFEQLYEASPEAIVLCTNESEILRVNAEFTRLFGYSKAEAIGANVDHLLAPEEEGMSDEARALTRRIAAGERGSAETIRRRKDGSLVDVSILGKPIRMDGEQIAVYGIYRDITARKRAEAALAAARRRVEQLHDAAERLERAESEDDVYRIVIETADQILGFPHCALDIAEDGRLTTRAVSAETPPDRIRRAPIARAGIAGETYRKRRTSIRNDVRPGEVGESASRPIRSLITVPIGDVGVFQAASHEAGAFTEDDARHLEILLGHTAEALARLSLQRELIDQAIHDPLTGLYNRRYFNDVIERETLRSARYDHPLGLLMIDVDRFKEINDSLGHQAGDDVLRAIADVLRACVRETDLIVRYGGDEFLVVFTETGEEAERAAERVRAAVRRNRGLRDIAGFPVSVSVGTTAWRPGSERAVEVALAQADERMYEDKRRR